MGEGIEAPEKVTFKLNTDACTAGYQPATEYLCLERMYVGKGAPENISSELKIYTCTAGYQPATESLCLGRMCMGQAVPKGVPRWKDT